MSEAEPSAASGPAVALRVVTRPAMLGLHLLLVVVVAAMVVAGVWQLGVYGDAQRDVTATTTGPAVPLERVLGPDDALTSDAVATRVVVRGTYAAAAEQFLVRGRENAGQQGYWVVSPLVVADTSTTSATPSALLVVRGWQPSAVAPPVPSGDVRVTGVLQPGEQATTTVGADRVVESVRIPALVNAVPFDLYSGYLLQTAEQPSADGLSAVTPPAVNPSWTAGLRNLAYALQWWVFAGFAVFMWWHICREEVVRRTTTEPSQEPAPVS